MINWIKGLLTVGIETDNIKFFEEVKQPKGKNISEPVYAIIETMQKYPSRFKVKFDENLSKNRKFTLFRVKDIKTEEKVIYSTYYCYGRQHRLSWSWLTDDEVEFLCEEGLKIYEKKAERKKSFERARMKELYK